MLPRTYRSPRDWRIELLRLFSMLLIVTAHYFGHDNWQIRNNPNLQSSFLVSVHSSIGISGQIGVTIFVLISAFFLSRSNGNTLLRTLKLWIQLFCFSLLIFLTYFFALKSHLLPQHYASYLNIHNVLATLFPVTFGISWFMTAFTILMLVLPFINKLLAVINKPQFQKLLLLSISITFIWKFLNPHSNYYNDFAYLLSIYLIGAYIQKHKNTLPSLKIFQVITIIFITFTVTVLGTFILRQSYPLLREIGYPINLFTAGLGASPITSVICGTTIFVYVIQKVRQKQPLTNKITVLITFLSPATLGVYLLHENPFSEPILWNYIFGLTMPAGIWLRLFLVPASITSIYLALLLISLVIERLLIQPLTRAVIGRIDAQAPTTSS